MHVYVRSIDDMAEACNSGRTRNVNARELKGKNIIYEEAAEHEDEREDGSDRNEEDGDYINPETMLNDSDYDVGDGDDHLFNVHVDKGIERDVLRREHRVHFTVDRGIGIVECDSNYSSLAPSDELHSMTESDSEGEEVMKPRVRYPEFVTSRDMADPTLKVGMVFKSLDEFKETCRSWAIKSRWQIKFKPNDKKRCKALCGKGCGWYIWCDAMVRDPHTFQIKSGQFEHSCTKEHNIRQVTSKWLAKTYLEIFRADPNLNLNKFIKCVADQHNIEVTISKAWRARKIAAKLLNRDENEQFANLQNYKEEILRTNPGSRVKFLPDEDDEAVFAGVYICLGPLINAFKAGCRRLIGVDGCFLKGMYGGQLLVAVGIDANDCIFPLAWAMVRKENKKNWVWFLTNIGVDFEIFENPVKWTFISDGQKGLILAFNQVFPTSEKRYCVRHIYTNFRKNWKGKEVKDMLWDCARSSYVQKFTKCMGEMDNKSHEVYEYLNEIPPQYWTRSHFQTHCKCDLLLNNICECFNSYILEARDKGIITCLEIIRCKLMKRLWEKRDAMKKMPGPLCPKIQKKLDKIKALGFKYVSTWSGGSKYQVVGPEGQFVVDTNERSCSCRRWDLTGIPCEHAVNALVVNRNKLEDYVDACYTVETYLKIYNNCINPINGCEMWPVSKEAALLPPLKPNPNKRRAKLRRLEAEELEKLARTGRVSRRGSVMTCTVCGVKGHNKRYHGKQPTDGDAGQQDNIRNDVTQTESTAFSAPTSVPKRRKLQETSQVANCEAPVNQEIDLSPSPGQTWSEMESEYKLRSCPQLVEKTYHPVLFARLDEITRFRPKVTRFRPK